MQNLIKIIIYSLCAICTLFIVFSLFKLNSLKSKKSILDIPQPYKSLYKQIKEVPGLQLLANKYEQDLYLIYGSFILGQVCVAIYAAVLPVLAAIIVMVIFMYIDIWYYAALMSLFSVLIPYFIITDIVDSKAKSIRHRLITTYQSAETHFANRSQVIEATQQIGETSSGAIRKLYLTFNSEYIVDRDKAFDNFIRSAGDKYASFFMTAVRRYDMYGQDPCSVITDVCNMATRHYQLLEANAMAFKSFKILAGSLLGLTILMNNFSAGPTGKSLMYIGMCVEVLALLLSMFYSRQY